MIICTLSSLVPFHILLLLHQCTTTSVRGLSLPTILPHSKQRISFSEVSIEDGSTIDHDDDEATKPTIRTIGERIKCGESIIQLANLATVEECNWLVKQCLTVADNATPTRELDKPGLIRIPTIAAAERASMTNTLCADPLPSNIDQVLQTIFIRAIEYIDDEIPSLSTTLFNTHSISKLLQNNQLKYSSREPAINVYSTGGQFLAHKDAQALTLLLPLSSPTDYTGGGTAFWTQDSRGHRVELPSIIQKPVDCGTALLFGGCVTHAGVAVESGHRVVFVASFSCAATYGVVKMDEQRDIYGDSL